MNLEPDNSDPNPSTRVDMNSLTTSIDNNMNGQPTRTPSNANQPRDPRQSR